MSDKILKGVEKTERVLIITLMIALLIVVIYTTIIFLGLLFGGIISSIEDSFSLDNKIFKNLQQVFGGFLSVLIGIELLHTIKRYLKEDVVHVEIVLLVALIGISRHIIDLDVTQMESGTIFGISSLIIALSVGYYLIKKGMGIKKK